ncbi:alpha-mannosidase 2-like isoform X2 [Teleopsis dalmanni]|uniref:alpha-mannosidase 2-like isoform X2 n=1 Tax=Teleopsis dalmanni TaxID=139649 RepID=UPI0018CE3C02|nr:alpha-mannosidase 2-like isoform X2 [Teleopsis dalmanni]XP_037947919.1 alpha-mannosidase 2-like isoform X2 [Teleopsis dalmanni]
MFRIRRRIAIIVCATCILLFLSFYFFINYAAPTEEKQELETGLKRHGQEMRHLKNKIERNLQDNMIVKDENFQKYIDVAAKTGRTSPPECAFDTQLAPQPDVQMLDLYEKMTFTDIDGGVWKQGWNIKYDPLQFNEHHKLKVFVVPHSHNDPGWIKTFEDYYEHDTKHILSNALRHLRQNPDMKFIWAEISYFSRFFEDLGHKNREEFKKLVQGAQFEFVTGGWVMPDEANSHWISILLQLTEGQTWLKNTFNITPSSSWSIDPFGHSPTLPYVLKKSGFKNLLIQRTHYSVKKELASNKNLEFNWRQLWDDTGDTELFTHMMPFYSYDIPHTCGPDPKICCQFDFKRIQGFGLSCPWRVPPQPISEQNVAQRAEMIVDQWKKKAELYRTNVVLIPLGDDFRYSQSTEWEVQRINYESLFEYINAERNLFVEAKFGTLQEYFDMVQQEKRDFPTLSGDFFTYADRADNYWSGYYTSRPYHKRMDRVLLHYVRSAEMLTAWSAWDDESNFKEKLLDARRELSLFQHHDGITGTAKNHVVADYALRLMNGIKACRFVMQQAVYKLLTKPAIYNVDYKFTYFHMDDSRWPGPDDSRTTIILGDELPSKHVVFHNSLPQWKEELVDFYVSSPFMTVMDFDNNPVHAQVSPVWTWHRHIQTNIITPQASTTKYRLIFKVKVPPLGLATYIINIKSPDAKLTYTTLATNLILNTNPISVNLGDYQHEVKFGEHREISLRVGDGPKVTFSADGLMKSIQIDELVSNTPIHLKFYKYGTRINGDRSGAYLFIPNGPATPFLNVQPPVVLITEGPLEASVTTGLPFVIHQTVLRGEAPEIRNLVDIGDMDDIEIAMRFSTRIKNADVFYTDLNGLQMIKRKRFSKLPLQANYYPMPTAMYIEDDETRLTVVSAQPLGGTSLAEGELEIMQDRRLARDDERGLGQGVLDNQPVLHIFRIILEQIKGCKRLVETHPSGALTTAAYYASKIILNPINKFIYTENDWLGVQRDFGADHIAAEDDVEVVTMRTLSANTSVPIPRDRKGKVLLHTGIVVHRTNLLACPGDGHRSGVLNLRNLLQFGQNITSIDITTLTFLHHLQNLEANELPLCPMDAKAFIVHHRS